MLYFDPSLLPTVSFNTLVSGEQQSALLVERRLAVRAQWQPKSDGNQDGVALGILDGTNEEEIIHLANLGWNWP
jgi:hypothetical protein